MSECFEACVRGAASQVKRSDYGTRAREPPTTLSRRLGFDEECSAVSTFTKSAKSVFFFSRSFVLPHSLSSLLLLLLHLVTARVCMRA